MINRNIYLLLITNLTQFARRRICLHSDVFYVQNFNYTTKLIFINDFKILKRLTFNIRIHNQKSLHNIIDLNSF